MACCCPDSWWALERPLMRLVDLMCQRRPSRMKEPLTSYDIVHFFWTNIHSKSSSFLVTAFTLPNVGFRPWPRHSNCSHSHRRKTFHRITFAFCIWHVHRHRVSQKTPSSSNEICSKIASKEREHSVWQITHQKLTIFCLKIKTFLVIFKHCVEVVPDVRYTLRLLLYFFARIYHTVKL